MRYVIGMLLSLLVTGAYSTEMKSPLINMKTNFGTIIIELNQEKAPQTIANFLRYINEGFYDGTIFHRVIDNFMIQGGGFTPDYQQKPTREPIENEANNGLKNDRGTIAMARTNDPHSATAQFFINVKNNNFLDHSEQTPRGWGYAVFGKVIEGIEVVDKIKEIPTGSGGPFRTDVPETPVIIEKVYVVEERVTESATTTDPKTAAKEEKDNRNETDSTEKAVK